MIWAAVLQATPAAPEDGDSLRRPVRARNQDGPAPAPRPAVREAAGEDAEEAFTALYREVARPLASYVRRTLGSPEEAHDVVQEVFYRYLRADLPAGTDPETARPYLYRSATHLLRDRWRRAKRDRSWREALAPPRESREMTDPKDRLLSADLDRALRRLKPRDRALLWLAHVEGRSHREIADVLSVGEASVRVMLFRARKKMEKVLHETGFPTEEWT